MLRQNGKSWCKFYGWIRSIHIIMVWVVLILLISWESSIVRIIGYVIENGGGLFFFWALGVILTNSYVLYKKICYDEGLGVKWRQSHYEFLQEVGMYWFNPDIADQVSVDFRKTSNSFSSPSGWSSTGAVVYVVSVVGSGNITVTATGGCSRVGTISSSLTVLTIIVSGI